MGTMFLEKRSPVAARKGAIHEDGAVPIPRMALLLSSPLGRLLPVQTVMQQPHMLPCVSTKGEVPKLLRSVDLFLKKSIAACWEAQRISMGSAQAFSKSVGK